MVSFYHNGEYRILSSIIRMGLGNSKVDSSGLGGIFCGILEDGRLRDRAFDTSGIQYNKHPSGAIFEEHYIPNFEECKKMVLMLAPRLVGVGRLLAWDLAIGEDGYPYLIEVNMTYGELDYHQMTNGPLFGDMTQEVIKEVFSNKTNRILNKILR